MTKTMEFQVERDGQVKTSRKVEEMNRFTELCQQVAALGPDAWTSGDQIPATVQAGLRENPNVTAEELAADLRQAEEDWAAELAAETP